MAERLMLLDSASLYFRAFYGVPDTVKAPNGMPVNAVRGFLDMIAKLVTTYEPTHLVACWDDDWRPQWRVDLIPSYKTHRVVEVVTGGPDVEEVPDPLEVQVPLIREALAALGITIIGAGTSLPELATSAVAAIRGESDIALGNVVGSSIFNILGILGATVTVQPLPVETGVLMRDLPFVVVLSILCWIFTATGRVISRIEGGVLLAAYLGYIVALLAGF